MSETKTAPCAAQARYIENVQIVRDLAAKYFERCEALAMKGKKADAYAVEYFCGAATLADLAGQKQLSEYLGRVIFYFIAPRGMFGIREYLAGLQ